MGFRPVINLLGKGNLPPHQTGNKPSWEGKLTAWLCIKQVINLLGKGNLPCLFGFWQVINLLGGGRRETYRASGW